MKDHERPTTKMCTDCSKFKELSFYGKNGKSKDGYLGQCKECRKLKRSNLKNTNPEAYSNALEASKAVKERLGKDHLKISKLKWNVANNEHVVSYRRKKYLEDPEGQRNRAREYRKANPQKHLASVYSWMSRNPNKVRATKRIGHAKRRAIKKERHVAWANTKDIRLIYQQAHNLTLLTGIAFHVDHIIPLSGKNVSGLHVESNLQILTAHDNIAKHNNFVDDIC